MQESPLSNPGLGWTRPSWTQLCHSFLTLDVILRRSDFSALLTFQWRSVQWPRGEELAGASSATGAHPSPEASCCLLHLKHTLISCLSGSSSQTSLLTVFPIFWVQTLMFLLGGRGSNSKTPRPEHHISLHLQKPCLASDAKNKSTKATC